MYYGMKYEKGSMVLIKNYRNKYGIIEDYNPWDDLYTVRLNYGEIKYLHDMEFEILDNSRRLDKNKNINEIRNSDMYLFYADGCENWSERHYLSTDEDVKDRMKYYDDLSDWKGNITAYKLVPVYKMKRNYLFSKIKPVKEKETKIKKTKKKKVNKK